VELEDLNILLSRHVLLQEMYFSVHIFLAAGLLLKVQYWSSFVLAVSFLLLGAILEWFCFGYRLAVAGSSTKVVNWVW